MAYNYFPTGYQQVIPQAYVPNSFQNGTSSQQSLIWVSGEAGAKAYMVAPNQTVVLWDSEAQVIYLKSADASGMPSIKVLDYTIRDNAAKSPENPAVSGYATHDEVIALRKEIDAIKAKFSERKDGKK